jgi:DNA (cytosine-5)-methyltransferase 1
LAHGIPVSLGRGRTREQRMAIRAARANRVGRLKGYGNAINPYVAAKFIRAYLES